MPTKQDIATAHRTLQADWTASPSPPSLEVFTEAVREANAIHYTSAYAVVRSLVSGRWP